MNEIRASRDAPIVTCESSYQTKPDPSTQTASAHPVPSTVIDRPDANHCGRSDPPTRPKAVLSCRPKENPVVSNLRAADGNGKLRSDTYHAPSCVSAAEPDQDGGRT